MSISLGEAIAIAASAHEDQLDRNGVDPYILHPLAVMAMVKGEDAKIVAVLHDVLEDNHNVSATYLLTMGLSEKQLSDLNALTRRYSETYRQYVERALNHSDISAAVKIADHRHNTDIQRMMRLPSDVRERLRKKYDGVSAMIREAAQRPGVQEYLV